MSKPYTAEELDAVRAQVERDLDSLRAIAPAGREFREPHPAMVTAQEAARLLATVDALRALWSSKETAAEERAEKAEAERDTMAEDCNRLRMRVERLVGVAAERDHMRAVVEVAYEYAVKGAAAAAAGVLGGYLDGEGYSVEQYIEEEIPERE